MKTRRTKAETEADLILRAAQRARPRPEFMAWLLAQAQTQQGCSEAQLAAQLGLASGQLPRLAFCFKPPPGPLQ
jgi:hypothetical protein